MFHSTSEFPYPREKRRKLCKNRSFMQAFFVRESWYLSVFWVSVFISVIRIFIQLLTIVLAYEKFHDISLFVFSLFFYRQMSDGVDSSCFFCYHLQHPSSTTSKNLPSCVYPIVPDNVAPFLWYLGENVLLVPHCNHRDFQGSVRDGNEGSVILCSWGNLVLEILSTSFPLFSYSCRF